MISDRFDADDFEACCESPDIRPVGGERVCMHCGLVHGNVLVNIERPAGDRESRDERWTHAVAPAVGARTVMDPTKDWTGRPLRKRLQRHYAVLGMLHRGLTSSEHNLLFALPGLATAASRLNLPSVVRDEAAGVYRKLIGKKLTRGRPMLPVMAACLYAAARIHGSTVEDTNIMTELAVERHTFRRMLGLITTELNLKVPPAGPERFLPDIVARLELPYALVAPSLAILEKVRIIFRFGGIDPRGIAGAIVYLTARSRGIHATQRKTSKAAGVTEVTLRIRAHEIEAALSGSEADG